jgi:hypothetical protein
MRETVLFFTGGVARSSLDHRLIAVKPSAWNEDGITNVLIPEGLTPLAGG